MPPNIANRDGIFNSTDFVMVFVAGEYEDAVRGNSTWEEGDWNGDGDFTTRDLVVAFQAGRYISAASPESIAFDSAHSEFVPDEILIGFGGEVPALVRAQGNSRALLHTAERFHGTKLRDPSVLMHTGATKKYGERLSTVWKLPAGKNVFEAITEAETILGVAYTEPSYVVAAQSYGHFFPNDSRFEDLHGMHNAGQTGGGVDADIDTPEA